MSDFPGIALVVLVLGFDCYFVVRTLPFGLYLLLASLAFFISLVVFVYFLVLISRHSLAALSRLLLVFLFYIKVDLHLLSFVKPG